MADPLPGAYPRRVAGGQSGCARRTACWTSVRAGSRAPMGRRIGRRQSGAASRGGGRLQRVHGGKGVCGRARDTHRCGSLRRHDGRSCRATDSRRCRSQIGDEPNLPHRRIFAPSTQELIRAGRRPGSAIRPASLLQTRAERLRLQPGGLRQHPGVVVDDGVEGRAQASRGLLNRPAGKLQSIASRRSPARALSRQTGFCSGCLRVTDARRVVPAATGRASPPRYRCHRCIPHDEHPGGG